MPLFNIHFKEIAKYALKNTYSEGSWLVKFLLPSTIGATATTLLVFKNLLEFTINQSIIAWICLFTFCHIIRFFYLFLVRSERYWHETYADNMYGNAIVYLKDGFSNIHTLDRITPYSEEFFKIAMIFMCEQLKKVFDARLKTECFVSIKVAGGMAKNLDANTRMFTIARDGHSIIRDTDVYKKEEHKIFGNTCFNSIHLKILNSQSESNDWYYVNNDIENTKDYHNTSKKCHPNQILPYNCELVVPIIPLHSVPETKHNLIGFICIDSKDGIFDEKYDVAIAQGVADGIFESIKKFKQSCGPETKQLLNPVKQKLNAEKSKPNSKNIKQKRA